MSDPSSGGGGILSPGMKKGLIMVAIGLLVIYLAPSIILGSVCTGLGVACDKYDAAMARLGGTTAPGQRYVGPGNRVQSMEQLRGDGCARPEAGVDQRGQWYGVGGIRYRMDVAPRSPNDLLCGNGKTAFWKSQ